MNTTAIQVNIRTNDRKWAAGRTIAADEGDCLVVTVTATNPEYVVFAGRDMVCYDLGARLPRDYANRWVLTPVSSIVAAPARILHTEGN
ncbi:hypothetical protein ABZ671_01125 [Micromonospora sp. NPDC006766]|uniref:hypothetical protein n=1 Tax=Micromonospora sp. NPDC006766 TaxID=3154778 RepID=UPI0033F2B0DF